MIELTEEGVVVDILSDQKAQVKVVRSSSCVHCASAGVCHSLGKDKEMSVIAANPVQAKVGQQVLLTLPSKTFLRASLIVYLIPLLALFGGAIIGQWLSSSQVGAVLGASLGLIVSFWGIWYYNRRLKPESYLPTITRIIHTG